MIRFATPRARTALAAVALGFAALAATLAGALPARAAPIYSSPMATPTASWFGYAAGAANQYVATSFVIAGSGQATASGAEWVGSIWPGWPAAGGFRLDFLDSVAGSGNVIATRTVTPVQTALGLDNAAGFPLVSYEAGFADVALTAGTQYYISISAIGANWLWGDGSDAAATTWFSYGNDPTWQFPTAPGRAVTLTGAPANAVAAVLAPGAALLFGLGLAAMGLRRRG